MRYLLAALVLFLPGTLLAQQKQPKNPGDEMIEKYLAAETDRLSQKYLDGAKSIDEWKQKRPRLYQEYMDMLGLWPLPEKTPLKATITGTLETQGAIVENLHFQSKPGLYVTANLYRPKKAEGKLPAIVYVCGHSNRGRDGNKTAFQDHGLWFANNGYVCIVLDTLQLAEIPAVHHGTYGRPWLHLAKYDIKDKDKLENRWWWHAIGYSPAAVEAWNGVRAIDYLCSRPEVDPAKIGVTGISGGGAATFWIAVADDRVKVAVPVSGMSDLESYVKNKVINGHCDCMFLYNAYQWDWTTIAAMVAPRPMLFANSDNDKIFPMDGNRRIITKLKKIYGMYDKENLVDEYVSVGGHDYRPDLRIAIFKFINKHLKGDSETPVEDSAKYEPLKGRELRVFPEKSDLPKDALNARIDETFIPAAKVALPEKDKFPEWKQRLMKELKSRVFPAFQNTLTAAKAGEKGTFTVTDPGIQVQTKPLADADFENRIKREDFFKQTKGDENWKVVFARGSWTSKSPPNYVERSHLLLGQTADAGRVKDVIATFLYLQSREKTPPRIVGVGQSGILAAYAALFEPSIKEVIVIDPPKSHKDGPYFLNVLRVLDIPEALGLLAPTPLTIIGGNDPAFDRTAEIYRLAGAADKLTRK